MMISLFFLLPLIILIVLYAIIAKNLITKDGKMNKVRPNKPELSLKARKQVVLMLGAVVLAFFTCLLPFRVLTLWIIIVPDENIRNLGVEKYYNILYFCRVMLYLNSAVNPILYNLMSSKFRKGFIKLCFCCFGTKHSIDGRIRTATFNTTTSTFVTQSFTRKSSSGGRAALSLDDLRQHKSDADNISLEKWYGQNLMRQSSTPFLVDNTCSKDNFRKIAIRNVGKQISLQNDVEETGRSLYQRQISYDETLLIKYQNENNGLNDDINKVNCLNGTLNRDIKNNNDPNACVPLLR